MPALISNELRIAVSKSLPITQTVKLRVKK